MLNNRWNHPVLLVTVCLSCLASIAGAAQSTQDDWGRPKVNVVQKNGKWTIEGLKSSVSLNPPDLQMTVTGRGNTWSMAASFPGDLVVENAGATMSLRLADAGRKEVSPYRTGFKAGLKITLADFTHKDTKLDLQLSLFVCLESQREELLCELVPAEKNTTILECCWPAGLSHDSFDTTIVPFMQGMLLPKDWPKKAWLYDTVCYGRGLYMPW